MVVLSGQLGKWTCVKVRIRTSAYAETAILVGWSSILEPSAAL
jgi:hypothetical protein